MGASYVVTKYDGLYLYTVTPGRDYTIVKNRCMSYTNTILPTMTGLCMQYGLNIRASSVYVIFPMRVPVYLKYVCLCMSYVYLDNL